MTNEFNGLDIELNQIVCLIFEFFWQIQKKNKTTKPRIAIDKQFIQDRYS